MRALLSTNIAPFSGDGCNGGGDDVSDDDNDDDQEHDNDDDDDDDDDDDRRQRRRQTTNVVRATHRLSSGSVTPASAAMVGIQSTVIAGTPEIVRPAGMRPGMDASPTTRWPPSQAVPLLVEPPVPPSLPPLPPLPPPGVQLLAKPEPVK